MTNDELLLSADALPGGFQFAAVTAGIKASGKPDFALVIAEEPASAAALYTANRVQAAPLVVDREHMARSGGRVRVVAVNSGNANCATGEAGLRAAREVCSAAAAAFGCEMHEVFPSSTGIIGVPLPAEILVRALPAAREQARATAEQFSAFARAILTTDTRPKVATATCTIGGKTVRIAGACKGAGMIGPQLVPHATMLAYVFTDAVMEPAVLDGYLRGAVEQSFNSVSIDGDTSTNDTVLLMASGKAGARVEAGAEAFGAALNEVCLSLARQIVDDGEGVTHVVELQIEGAASDADARLIAKTIAHSPLVKTAWAGNDPNWGRLMAAIGYSGVAIVPEKIGIWFGEHEICRQGGRSPLYDEATAHAYLKQREFSIRIALGLGDGTCRFWTTDLTSEYVHINADYST
jgi:glutamate N-acetyltransferase/amino-acid N-acetyltransferase